LCTFNALSGKRGRDGGERERKGEREKVYSCAHDTRLTGGGEEGESILGSVERYSKVE
jgi:hypothetical protein